MKSLLVTTVLAFVSLLSLIGLSQYRDYEFRNSADGIAAAKRLTIETKVHDDLQSRVQNLSIDGCGGRAATVIAQHAKKPITSKADIPSTLLSDLELCLERGITTGYVRDRLEDAGVLKLLTAT